MIDNNVKIIKHKVGLLNLAEELGNVSRACKVMGLSRDTFYRYKSAVETGGVEALFDQTRRKPNHKNRVEEPIELAVKDYAIEYPAHGQLRTSNELRKKGIFVSPSGVRSVWLRYNLANFKDRLKALEDKVASEGIILTESQVAALEKKKFDDEACGEIETAHPGYLGSQDTFYVGTLKGVGRVYQQTFVDTYSKVAFAKLYTTKTPITSADILNDKVLPFFEHHKLPMLRILTDRALNTAARWSIMIISFIWPSTILTTPKQKCNRLKQMEYVNASIKQFCKSFIKSLFARSFMIIWMNCKKIWTNGSIIIIMSALIRAKCAADEHRCKH